MDAMDDVDSESLSEFDDPALDAALASLLDGTDPATDVANALAPLQQQQQQQHTLDDDFSDLSSEFASDRSSEYGDFTFDQELIAHVDTALHKYSTAALPPRVYSQLQKPANPKGSYVIPDPLCCPPPTDIDCVRVSPVCGFQSADMRVSLYPPF